MANSKSVTPSLRQANLFESAGVKGKLAKQGTVQETDGKKTKDGNPKFVRGARRVNTLGRQASALPSLNEEKIRVRQRRKSKDDIVTKDPHRIETNIPMVRKPAILKNYKYAHEKIPAIKE